MLVHEGVQYLEFVGGPFDGSYAPWPEESLTMVSHKFYWKIPLTGRLAFYRYSDLAKQWIFLGVAMPEDVIVPDWQI